MRPLLTVAVIVVLLPAQPRADPVSIFDGNFNPEDWTYTVLQEPTNIGPVNLTIEQSLTGGDPDLYRRMIHEYPTDSLGAFEALHVFLVSAYDPSSQGAIERIDYSEDAFLVEDGGFASFVNSGVAVIQGAGVWRAGFTIRDTATDWETFSLQGLLANDFDPIYQTGTTGSPDFSSSGSPISFGYIRYSAPLSGGRTYVHGIDNFTVTVIPVPEPTSLSLEALGVFLATSLGLARRRRGHDRRYGATRRHVAHRAAA